MARGWIDEAHRGFFPDLALDLVARFDVVSMCHYLEHTLDIRAELDAAALVLKEGGLLFIEVPDPQSIFARLMGRWWMPWFQPQHLQIVTTDTMSALLEEAGFEPLQWHTGEAAASNDLLLAISNMVRRWAPPLDVPWRPEPSAARLLTHGLVWSFGGGLILAGAILDKILAPIVRRSSHASQFRVIARKVSAPLAEGLLTTA